MQITYNQLCKEFIISYKNTEKRGSNMKEGKLTKYDTMDLDVFDLESRPRNKEAEISAHYRWFLIKSNPDLFMRSDSVRSEVLKGLMLEDFKKAGEEDIEKFKSLKK